MDHSPSLSPQDVLTPGQCIIQVPMVILKDNTREHCTDPGQRSDS